MCNLYGSRRLTLFPNIQENTKWKFKLMIHSWLSPVVSQHSINKYMMAIKWGKCGFSLGAVIKIRAGIWESSQCCFSGNLGVPMYHKSSMKTCFKPVDVIGNDVGLWRLVLKVSKVLKERKNLTRTLSRKMF